MNPADVKLTIWNVITAKTSLKMAALQSLFHPKESVWNTKCFNTTACLGKAFGLCKNLGRAMYYMWLNQGFSVWNCNFKFTLEKSKIKSPFPPFCGIAVTLDQDNLFSSSSVNGVKEPFMTDMNSGQQTDMAVQQNRLYETKVPNQSRENDGYKIQDTRQRQSHSKIGVWNTDWGKGI